MRWHPTRYALAALLGVLFLFLPVSVKFPALQIGKDAPLIATDHPPAYIAFDVAQAAPCPGGSVTVTSGSSSATVQSLITANPAGTNFCFQNGTYLLSNITPKTNNGFYAQNQHLAILDGNLTAQSAFTSTFGFGSSANVDGVVLDGFVIRRYRNSNPYGTKISAVDANDGWKLRNLIVEDNSGGVAFAKTNWDCAYNVEISNSIFRNNTHYALYFNGRDADITDNTFYNNGYGGSVTDRMWEGSIKITNQGINGQSSICPNAPGAFINITGNLTYGNAAAGWWQDINVEDFLFQDNDVLYNERWGFFQEIADGTSTSGTQRVTGNRFECNRTGWSGGGAWGGAEINNISSSNVEISNNLVRVCPAGRTANIGGQNYTTNYNGRGIILLSEGRRALNSNTVLSNIVCMLGTTENLSELQQYAGSNSGNSFQDNDYYVTSLGQSKYQRFGTVTNFSGWNSFAFDTTGSESTSACPTGIVIAPTPTPSPTITPGGPTFTPTPSSTPTITPNPSAGCFYGAPQLITNKIEAEDFNLGANNVAYYDTTPGMEGGVIYRNTDVDLKPSAYGGHAVGWFTDGEYLNYCVNVPTSGEYDLVFFGGSTFSGRVGHIEIDGADVTGDIAIPQTLDWNTYTTVTVQDVSLAAGNRTLTIVNELGFFDVDWIQFFVDGESPTITPTPGIPNGLCPPSTTLGPNLVVNSNFATGAGAGPGFAPAAGFTASVVNAGDNVFPDDTEVSVNNLPFSYFSGAFQEVPFAGDSPNGVSSAGAGLLHSGNNSGGSPYTIWQQTISGLSPSTTYIFWVYVNNAENEFRTDPAVFPTYGLWAYTTQLGVTVNVPRQPNDWIRIERSYTTGGSQTAVDLLIRDHTPDGTVNNDDGVITQPGFARCLAAATITPTYTASPTGSPTPTRTPTPSITPGGPTLTPIVITNTPGGVPSCTRCTILQTQTPAPTSTP